LTRNEERLRQEGLSLREQLTDTRNENNQLTVRVEERNTEIRAITNQMTNLRIESNERNLLLQETRRELTRTQAERDERITATDLQNILAEVWEKDKEISTLREQLSQSQEGGLTERLRNREQRLESFAHRLGIDWQIVRNL